MNTFLITLIVSFGIAFILGILLGFFKKLFYVPVDENVAKIRECLPGANCGGCGFPGCDGFATAAAAGAAAANGCTAGGEQVTNKVAAILGVQASTEKVAAVLACRGGLSVATTKGHYTGIKSCAATKTVGINGTKLCQFGCIGFGDCVTACKFDALKISEDGLPVVDYSKCTGCGACAKTCPQSLIHIVSATQTGAIALCSNRSTNKPSILKQCKVGCIKCGKCERTCTKGAITLVNGIPEIDYAKCTSCGDCVKECPTNVLVLKEELIKTC